jgi:hypothetical protein
LQLITQLQLVQVELQLSTVEETTDLIPFLQLLLLMVVALGQLVVVVRQTLAVVELVVRAVVVQVQ